MCETVGESPGQEEEGMKNEMQQLELYYCPRGLWGLDLHPHWLVSPPSADHSCGHSLALSKYIPG